jgi:hypothetical protein
MMVLIVLRQLSWKTTLGHNSQYLSWALQGGPPPLMVNPMQTQH